MQGQREHQRQRASGASVAGAERAKVEVVRGKVSKVGKGASRP